MSTLSGKVAIITGGGQGTGLGIARAYVQEGIAVVITGRTLSHLEDAKAELEALVPGARVLIAQGDNRDRETPARIVAATIEEFGRLDILINNAQIFHTGIPVEEITWDQMLATYESGIFATWQFMVQALPYLKETEGTIINMGSGAGTQSVAGGGAYGSNKEAIRGMSRIAAREWGKQGITVNVINPWVHSAESIRFMADPAKKAVLDEILAKTPLGRIGDAELNVGSLCVYLATEGGKYMTGSTFDVEGGSSMRP